MAVSVNALLPNTPPTTAIQDPAARTWANSVANILSASQSSAYAVQQLSKAAEALAGGGSVPPSIAQWLFSSELYWKLTQAIEKVDVAAKQAIIAEALERANAIAQEQVDRADAIFAESQARSAAIQAEVDARTNAINAERDARVAALAAEALARGTAITNEATVRQSEDEALAQQITTLTGVVDNNVAAIQDTLTVLANEDAALAERISIVAATSDAIRAATAAMVLNETRARADSDSAFAQQITTLSAAVDDNAANIQTESTTRASQYDALAEQITLVSAGVGEQFDFKQIWYFDDGVDGWTGNGVPTVSAGWLRPANHATDPYVDSPAALAVTATQHNQVRLRIRKYGTPTWAGKLWWKRTTDSTWDVARSIVLDEPTYDGTGIGLVSVSVSWADTIDQVRLALSTAQDATNYFTIDWFAVGRPSPGASTAALLNEATARATADTALTNQLNSLSSTVTGNYGTLNAAITTEATTRANADSALSSQINSVSATASGKNKVFVQSATPAATQTNDLWIHTGEGNKTYRWNGTDWVAVDDARIAQTAAAVVTETNARVDGDDALADQITALTATVGTNDSTVRGLITSEATTRASEDEALARTVDLVSATAESIRVATAAMAVSETVARANQDEAFVSRFEVLEATVGDNTAAITAESTARADADGALTTQINTVSSVANGRNRTFRQSTAPTGATNGDLWYDTANNNSVKRWDGSSWVTTDNTRIASNEAAIVSEATTRANNDTSIVNAVNTMWAITGATNALSQSGNNIVTNWTTAQANYWSNLNAEVFTSGGQTIRAALQQEATTRANADGALGAQWTLKTDINGYISGFGFASTANNATPTSEFIIRADKFAVVMPGYGEHVPFAIGPSGADFLGNVTGTVNGTSASTLVSTANTALTNANAAQTAANTANSTLADIAADNKLTPGEKRSVRVEWDAIYAERASIRSQADAFSITTEKTNYDNAFQALGTYLNAGTAYTIGATPPSWITDANLSVTTNIVGATFRTNWATLYQRRQELLNKIADVASKRAEWASISGAGKPENGATVGAPAGTLVAGIPAANVATAVTDFNASNNRNSAAITAPTIPTDGTAVDHVAQTDGSVDISFEWGWSGNEGDIDGFLVYARPSTSSSAYTLGTTPAEETVYTVPANKRAFVLFGVAADKYYTFGVQAYRAVDKAINAAGVIKSTLVKATGSGENPYRPSSTVAFTGDVTGTISGTSASTVVSNASTALTNANAAQTAANTANAALADIAADNKLTPAEKKSVRKEWDAIYAERAGIRAQADSFGITTEKTNYDNDFQALGTYLNGGTAYTIGATPPSWITDANLATTTTIVGTTFRANWSNLYADRQALLNKIAAEAAKRADWASVTNKTGFASISQITSSNVTTYIDNGAIGNAQIGGDIWSSNHVAGSAGWRIYRSGNAEFRNITARGDIEASSLKANTAMVQTLNIAGNAVIVPAFVEYPSIYSSNVYQQGTAREVTLLSDTVTVNDACTALVQIGCNDLLNYNTHAVSAGAGGRGHYNWPNGTEWASIRLYRNDTLVTRLAQWNVNSTKKGTGVHTGGYYATDQNCVFVDNIVLQISLVAGVNTIDIRGWVRMADGDSTIRRNSNTYMHITGTQR